jgi:hypothetical protein
MASLRCPDCGWSFRSEKGLGKHMEAHHGVVGEAVTSPATRTSTVAEVRRPVGTVYLVISYAAAVLFWPAGLIAGILLLARGQRGHGIAVLAISLTLGALQLIVAS